MTEENIGYRLGDLSDIPEDMQKQIKGLKLKAKQKKDKTKREHRIINIINNTFCGFASVDEIYVQLFRETGRKIKRSYLISFLSNMSRRGVILRDTSLSERSGIYCTKKVT